MDLAQIRASVGRGFRLIAVFSGRDDRREFWTFTLALVGVSMMVMPALIAPSMFFSVVRGSAPDFRVPLVGVTVVSVSMVVVLASAVCRRLHDTGRSGRWGLLPVPSLLVGLGLGFTLMGSTQEGLQPSLVVFALSFASNVVYFVLLTILIVLLVRPGTAGSNRYGPAMATERPSAAAGRLETP